MRLRQLTLPVKSDPRSRMIVFVVAVFLLLSLVAACGPSNSDENATAAPDDTPPAESDESGDPTAPAVSEEETPSEEGAGEEAYPGPGAEAAYPGTDGEEGSESGYPSPGPRRAAEITANPPDPERTLPEASSDDLATVGGVLVEEIVGEGFVPLMPVELTLGRIIETTAGEPAFLSAGSDSPKAELFPTGVFIFRNVEPGTYGLVVDVGYTEFPVETSEDELFMFDLESGQVLDLGQVITPLPN